MNNLQPSAFSLQPNKDEASIRRAKPVACGRCPPWVGLTGGIASGKSTVSQIFKKAGAFIIDADSLAHDLLKKGAPAYTPVLNRFGTAILDAAGEIDRAVLGRMVFHTDGKRMALNRIIHPFIFDAAERERVRIASENPRAVILFDAPLLIETGAHAKTDMLILVYVDRQTQIERLILRDRCSRSEAEHRIGLQIPLDEKVRLANEVIDNRKPLSELQASVLEIYRCLCWTSDRLSAV